ncbi:MAG: TonB-dependent receptor, partial [Emticicia sp.]|nr:TonB-dependent receptor [Emticicia sp.]
MAVICLSIHLLYSQNITVSGKISDKATGEVLPYVSVFLPDITRGVQSNQYGFYSVSLNKGVYKIKYSNIGYDEKLIEISLKKDTIINVGLEIANNYLNEVEVNAIKKSTVDESAIGTINIPIERLKSVPAIFGEVDILKALALTPGVSSSSEGSAGLIVRGGTPDQNLILLDDVPLYNVSHLFGMVSVFNPDVFKKVDLYKGSFPARYGGRLSSVIDVVTKEGSSVKKNREFSIGLLSSKIFLEGPLSKQNSKTSYLVALRSTYFTPFLLPTMISFKKGNLEQYFNYWMYDSNIKINHQINQKQQVFLSFYQGHDYWTTQEGNSEIRNKFGLSWGNRTLTFRYNNILSPKVFLKTIAGYTRYNYQNSIGSLEKLDNDWKPTQSLNSISSVRDYLAKVHFDYFPNINHQIKFGTDLVFHKFQPSYLKTTYYINPDTLKKINTPVYSSELSLFAEDEIRLNKYLKGNIGLRLVNYHVNSVNYYNIEPRISININLLRDFTLKGGYVKMNQNIQLLSSNTVGLPNDIWIPATAKIPPSRAQQVSLGLAKSFRNKYEFSFEIYQKNLENLIDYPTGTNFLNTFYQNWENIVERNGTGQVRGFELFLNKTQGRLTGWVSYTYMKNQYVT